MRKAVIWVVLSLANPATRLWGEDPAAREQMRKSIEAAAETQRTAVIATTAAAVTAQQASVRKQIRSAARAAGIPEADAYFMLPSFPPPEMPASFSADALDCEPLAEAELDPLLKQAVAATGVNRELLRAVIGQESGGRPCAVSRVGAQGLMQLMPGTAEQFGVTDVFDPQQNVLAGAKFLKQLLERYAQDLPRALGAYNAGLAETDRAGAEPPVAETQQYVRGIMEAMRAPQLAIPEPQAPAAALGSPPRIPAATTANPSASAPTGSAQKRPLPADKLE